MNGNNILTRLIAPFGTYICLQVMKQAFKPGSNVYPDNRLQNYLNARFLD